MEEVLGNPELLDLLLHGVHRTTRRQVCVAWRLATDGDRRPEPPDQVKELRDGTWTAGLTQGRLAQLLALTPNQVACYPHHVRRRCGGGECHIFDAATVLSAFHEHGGIQELAHRIRRIAERSRARDGRAAEQGAQERTERLDRGLAAIGLAPRSDSYWQRRALGSASFWRLNLAATLRSAAWMHWLHEHTHGRYRDAVEATVKSLADDAERHYPGIYAEASSLVQQRAEFQLPVDGLPWLPPGETTEMALLRAEHTVDPQLLQRKRRWEGVLKHRKQAKVERAQAFNRRVVERFAGLSAPPSHIWKTSARVCAYLARETIQVPAREREEAFEAVEDAARIAAQLAQIQGAQWSGISLDHPASFAVQALQARIQ
eukprot:scaffold6641_cov118-Isochrysis_galbana.AAC.1